jgi:hypothetical protein
MKAIQLLAPAAALLTAAAVAAPPQSATVTKVINDVRIYGGSADGRAASEGSKLNRSNSVHTGRRSRAELTFSDTTLTRIGANSVFSMSAGGREVELEQGTMLIQVPKDTGGATIRTATVTASITGSTALFAYIPGRSVKLINVEGTMKLGVKQTGKGMSRTVYRDVQPGEIITMHPNGRDVPAPMVINLARLLRTSGLAGSRYFGQLPAGSRERIDQAIASQMSERRAGNLAPTGVVLRGSDRPAGEEQSTSTETPVRDSQRSGSDFEQPRSPDFPGNPDFPYNPGTPATP